MAMMNDPRNPGAQRGFGMPPELTPPVPPVAPAPEAPAEGEEEGAPEEIMEAAETAPIDEEHIAEEAKEPPEVQYLEEILGVEIPQEMWPKVVAAIQAREGKTAGKPVAPESSPEEKPAAPVFQRFGNPVNAY